MPGAVACRSESTVRSVSGSPPAVAGSTRIAATEPSAEPGRLDRGDPIGPADAADEGGEPGILGTGRRGVKLGDDGDRAGGAGTETLAEQLIADPGGATGRLVARVGLPQVQARGGRG